MDRFVQGAQQLRGSHRGAFPRPRCVAPPQVSCCKLQKLADAFSREAKASKADSHVVDPKVERIRGERAGDLVSSGHLGPWILH